MRGLAEESLVSSSFSAFVNYREREAIRLCLKHFRQRNYLELFQSVQAQTGMELEHRLLTELHQRLVISYLHSRLLMVTLTVQKS